MKCDDLKLKFHHQDIFGYVLYIREIHFNTHLLQNYTVIATSATRVIDNERSTN